MQLLSLAALGPEAQRLLDELSVKLAHDFTGEVVVLAAITIVLAILSAWLAAQVVARENAKMMNAVQTGLRWVSGILVALILAGAAFYFSRLRVSPTMTSASLAIGAILIVYTAISAPMKVYRLPFVKGLAFGLIAFVIQAAAHVAVQKAMHDPLLLGARIDQVRRLAALSPAEASEVLKTLKSARKARIAAAPEPVTPAKATPAPATAPLPAAPPAPKVKSIAERLDDLKKVYGELMAQREELKPGDEAGLAAYNRDSQRYTEQLAELQKEYDAQKK